MSKSIIRRIERLERVCHVDANVDKAREIVHAYHLVQNYPHLATDEHRALRGITSHEDWQRAFLVVLETEGGHAAVVQRLCEAKS